MATAVPASADLQYTLACQDVACASPSNYGTVTLHQTSGSVVKVSVDLSLAGDKFNNAITDFALTWNILGQNVDNVDNITSPNPGNFQIQDFSNGQKYRASPFTGNGSCNAAGSDCFGYAIDYTSSGPDVSLIFDVTRNAGLALTDFVSNTYGFRFVSDIAFVDNQGNEAFVVGAKDDGVYVVPEPSTWLLFFAGLVGLTLLQRRRKPARAA